ncbi:MAG: response regulator [Xanthomonadales bacterium]|nr:response regulator [Xanthomonadales bacterium]
MGDPSRAANTGRTLCVDLLGGGDSMHANISGALAEVGGRLRRFERAEQWVEALQSEVSDAAIVPASLSAAIAETLAKLSLSGVAAGNMLLATFGRPKERLDALIGGADWFFERSTDPLLGQALVDWLQQQNVTPFRVLLIDDDRETRLLCSAVLRKVGMVVEELAEAVDVVEAVRHFRPDLVLLDLHMPDQDGIAVVQALRSSDVAPLLPVVFMSGEDRPSARSAALRAGADDFLTKPVRPQALISAVRSRAKRARAFNRQLRAGAGGGSGKMRRGDFLATVGGRLQQLDERWHVLLALRLDQANALRDALGLAGTQALEREVAARLASCVVGSDCYALWEEMGFGLLVSRYSAKEVEAVIGRVLAAVASKPFEFAGVSHPLSASVGYAAPPHQGEPTTERWLQQAFAALAMGLRLGGGQAKGVLSRDPGALSPERIMVINQALEWVARGGRPHFEFQAMLQLRGEHVHYSLRTHLADLRNPLGGYPRGEFLALAREAKQLGAIDRMTLSHAIETLEDGRRRGVVASILVPVDLASFDDAQLAWLRGERQARPEALGDLQIELDAEALRSGEHAETVRQLHALGISLAASDASGGVKALQDLLRAPIDLLRLSHTAIQKEPLSRLTQLISHWRGGGRRILVDGVESMQSVASLWNLGIDYLQGDALAAPAPRAEED